MKGGEPPATRRLFKSPLTRFVVAALAWLPVTFGAWYWLGTMLLWPVRLLLQLLTRVGFSDLVRGINLVMESDFHEPINLGNPQELTILDIAKEVLALIPESKSQITFLPMPPDDPKVRKPDITRAKQILGWQPQVSRREGLGKMIEFYRESLKK